MPSYRAARTSEDVMRELTAILREMKDPRIAEAMLSIVKIDLSSDLSSCQVFVSSMKDLAAAQEAVKVLKNGAGFLRRELGGRLKLRHTPELRFTADNSIEHSAEISKILHRLEQEGRHED
ncbi:30S ribosome-binding factor RbfA [Yanshouia hominis]|uniref:Ribosome-binding factor A n=1 Tax=Yanshouia hominis TaxID=2763673 RepID=A0ABR7NIH6_9FIRM|nr:30S ribosome-binding factor RbfA [Yanshouia hominis]MBC8575607.1 30S ribosome-binding factor RbfA [Yanshouia hominis]